MLDLEATVALTKMLASFPGIVNDQMQEAKLSLFEEGLEGVTSAAIRETAGRFMRGEVPEQNRSFSPTIAEFRPVAIGVQEAQELRARPRLPKPTYRPGILAPFQITQQRKLAENAHLPVIKEDVSYDDWRRMSMAREVPTGAKWVASVGIVYGPENKAAMRS